MNRRCQALAGLVGGLVCGSGFELPAAEPGLVTLNNPQSVLAVTTAGGGIVEIRLKGNSVNPLNWTIHGLEPVEPGKPYLRGHFLCLARWGAPSAAEAKRGVPFHGEAPRVNWKLSRAPEAADKYQWLTMECRLPLAGLSVVRKITLARNSGVALISETVVNDRKLGRIYNMVQHPSIAAPFLDDSTLVDSNAPRGISQEGEVPARGETPSLWPQMVIGKQQVALRRFRSAQSDGTIHDVSSFVFENTARNGWVTAANPKAKLLLGYVWKTRHYPWLNIWRHREGGRVKSRGLEFGTTGLHQPYSTLVAQGKIFDRPLYTFIDAGQSTTREYMVFVTEVPANYAGVHRLVVGDNKDELVLWEQAPGKRRIRVPIDLPDVSARR